METRKYFTELGLAVTVLGQYLGRQPDFERQPSLPVTCNLYIVTRRPRVSIDPATVHFSAGYIQGIVRLQKQSDYVEIPFRVSSKKLGVGPFSYKSDWPYEEFEIIDSKGRVASSGVVALAAIEFGMVDPRRIPQEVLYVGQAFGKHGERTAFDRLKSHSTLQRIYAENRPDKEIWLSLCRISDLNLFFEFNPNITSRTTDEEDEEHRNRVLRRINSSGFKQHEAVAIAEAGLIRYFQPEYNEIFKNNYPDPKHVHISTCYDLDLATIVVELQGQEIHGMYYSDAASKPNFLHFARYPLYSTAGFITDWHGGRPRGSTNAAADE